MSWDIEEMRIHLRLERDNPERDIADNIAHNKLVQAIRDLIEADADYRRIVTCGP